MSPFPFVAGASHLLHPRSMHPQNLLRAVVSIPKQTHVDSNRLLDLSYITPRIIVAAGPSDDFLLNLFRSPICKVVDYLNKNYKSESHTHWHIWNLRGEGAGYNGEQFDANWTHYPFPDHMPPSLKLTLKIVSEIDNFLKQDSRNVALIHCKEGKGRSGTICCSYLMYEAKQGGVFLDPEEVIGTFTKRRMKRHFGDGISIKSQIRYLHYWKRFLQFSPVMRTNFNLYNLSEKAPFNTHFSVFTKITIHKPSLLLVLSKLQISSYVDVENGLRILPISTHKLKLPSISSSDCYYEVALGFSIKPSMKDIMISFNKQICIAYLWLNLYLESLGALNRPLPLENSGSIFPCRRVFKWSEFDGFRGTKSKNIPQLFDKLEIQWIFHYSV